MQVSNLFSVLYCLRNGHEPQWKEPIQWTELTDEWEDDLELYERLKKRYESCPDATTATQWSQYIASLRPVDWQYFMEFFTVVPKEFQTPEQVEVAASKASNDTSILTMQMLYRHEHKNPSCVALLRHPKCMNHMRLDKVLEIAQQAWSTNSKTTCTRHLPERLIEFLETYPSAIEPHTFPTDGVGLLLGAILVGVENQHFAVNLGEDEQYYRQACQTASLDDVQKLVRCLIKYPKWAIKIHNDLEMPWYEPFMQQDHPHRALFNIYQSLDPQMELKQLAQFLTMQNKDPEPAYALESISVS